MNEISVLHNSAVTMSSREIAELTGKQHFNILRDIDETLKTLNPDLVLGFKSTTYKDSSGKQNRMFVLDRDSTYCLIAGYDANVRMKIIKRWQELEGPQKQMTTAELMVIQAQQIVDIEREQKRITSEQASQAKRLDQIETASDHFTVIGWWRYAKQSGSLDMPSAAKMGSQASKYCKANEIQMGQVPDPRFGVVKTYPKWVLEELFSETVQ